MHRNGIQLLVHRRLCIVDSSVSEERKILINSNSFEKSIKTSSNGPSLSFSIDEKNGLFVMVLIHIETE